jgi:replicative DNA helicase
MNLEETQTNILTGVFGKSGGDQDNFLTVMSSEINGFAKPSYDFLWKKAVAYYHKTNDIVSYEVIKRIVKRSKKLTSDVKLLYLSELRPLFSKQNYRRVKNNKLVKFSLAELNSIKRQMMFNDIIYTHVAAMNAGDIDEANELINRTIGLLNTRLLSSGQPDYMIVDYGSTFEKRQAERKKEKENPDDSHRFRYRYRSLNKIYSKGHRGGDVIVLSGITGIGKSIMSGDVAAMAAEQGLKTAYIYCENTTHQVSGRFDSNFTGYEYDMIQAYGFNSSSDIKMFEKTFKEMLDIAKNIKLIKTSPNNFTILTIIRALHELRAKHSFNADVVVIDSPDLMKPSVDLTGSVGNSQYTRFASTAVYWDIKGFAIEHDVIVFCTSQLTREAGKRKNILEASAEDVADDYNKVRICDAMIILLETIDMALSNQIALKIGKNRDGCKPVEPIILFADKARMKFHDIDTSTNSILDSTATTEMVKQLDTDFLVPKK